MVTRRMVPNDDIEAGGDSEDESEPPPSGVSAQLLALFRVFVMLWAAPFRALLSTARQRPPALVGPAGVCISDEEEDTPSSRSSELPPSPGVAKPFAPVNLGHARTPVATPEPLWPAEAAPPGATADEGVPDDGASREADDDDQNSGDESSSAADSTEGARGGGGGWLSNAWRTVSPFQSRWSLARGGGLM